MLCVAQSCPTLCDPMDCSPPGSSVHGILQARTLEWVAIPFSRGSSQPRDQTQVSHTAGGFFTSWATRAAQKYWSGQPIPSPEGLRDPGIELASPALQGDSLPAEPQGKPSIHYLFPSFSLTSLSILTCHLESVWFIMRLCLFKYIYKRFFI